MQSVRDWIHSDYSNDVIPSSLAERWRPSELFLSTTLPPRWYTGQNCRVARLRETSRFRTSNGSVDLGDQLPFSCLKKDDFRHMCDILHLAVDVTSRQVIRNRVISLEYDYGLKKHSISHACTSTVALTTDALSPFVYEGYTTVTYHCVDKYYTLFSATI